MMETDTRQVGSSSYAEGHDTSPTPAAYHTGKKRFLGRSRARNEQEEMMGKVPSASAPREHPKLPQSSSEVQKATSSDKKGPRSEYDFPDSPDDERPLVKGGYKGLSGSTRSPRRGVVDSSENSRGPHADQSRSSEGQIQSSSDVHMDRSEVGSSHISADQSFHRRSAKHEGMETEENSNISHPSIDSTDRMVVEESQNIDSSSNISSPRPDRPKSARSSRDSDNSPRSSSDVHDMGDRVSQSKTPDSGMHPMSYGRSRSPRGAPESSSQFSVPDQSSRPHSSSDGSNQPVVSSSSQMSMQYGGGNQQVVSSMGHDSERNFWNQERAPLLLPKYETLSDDDD